MKKLDMEQNPSDGGISKLTVVVLSLLLIIISLAVGIGIGVGIERAKDDDCPSRKAPTLPPSMSGKVTAEMQTKRYGHHRKMLDAMQAQNIGANLKEFTALPHYPGSDQSKKLAEKLQTLWVDQGFEDVKLYKYNIYLSYPQKPGEITLHGRMNKTLKIMNEPSFDESENTTNILYPFNAFAKTGSVTAELVFVNYCRDSDFEAVIKAGVNVTGKIAICKYGKGSRTMKTVYSEQRGVIGLIIYTDPDDHTYKGQEYPKGWMLNQYGVQRGTVNRLPGDALSIGYPSKDGYFRLAEEKYSGNPVIPVQPISYGTAFHILSWMNDSSIGLPSGFGGGLNFTYRLQSGTNRTLQLKIDLKLETKETYTVCGKLYGKGEPDRYVMFGNHRDAWTFGASDPSSGTATMMEIVRSIGHYKKANGWRPYRSIMACSWGAEESGIQGSTEWADDHHKFLREQVVMYLNVDMAVEGNFTVRMKTLDSIIDGIFDAAKTIKAPDNPSITLYKDWYEKSLLWRNKTAAEMKEPYYMGITSGSDYKVLWHSYGTPAADFRYYFSRVDFPKLPQNGHYHTMYESYGWMSKKVDPGFIHHLAIGQLWAGHLLLVADSNLIPYDIVKFTKQVKEYLIKFETTYKTLLDNNSVSLAFAKQRMDALVNKSEMFQQKVKQMMDDEKFSPLRLRQINDKIMNFERSFIKPGISSNPVTQHTVYATTYYKLYNEKFPGISEAIYNVVKENSTDWDSVKKQVTYLVWCIDTANMSLDLEEYTM